MESPGHDPVPRDGDGELSAGDIETILRALADRFDEPVDTGCRLAHRHGVVVTGRFVPVPVLRERFGGILGREACPVTVRFSATAARARPTEQNGDSHGMAVRFQHPAGTADLIAVDVSVFPMRSAALFPDFLRAAKEVERAALGAPLPRPSSISLFAAGHPESIGPILTFLRRAQQRGPIASFCENSYYGVHAFWLRTSAGERLLVRYRWEPAAGERRAGRASHLLAPDQLQKELAERLGSRRLTTRFTLSAELGGPDQSPDDVTASWPSTLPRLVLGHLELDPIDDGARLGDDPALAFDPTNPPPPFEPTDDPLIWQRRQVYAAAAQRRASAQRGAGDGR